MAYPAAMGLISSMKRRVTDANAKAKADMAKVRADASNRADQLRADSRAATEKLHTDLARVKADGEAHRAQVSEEGRQARAAARDRLKSEPVRGIHRR